VALFTRNEEGSLLADSLQRLLHEANAFEERRRRLRGDAPDRQALWAQLAELGVIAAAFNPERGGIAGDARTLAIIMAQLGAALVVEPYLATAVVAGSILQRWNEPAASQAAIDAILSGSRICVVAHTGFSDPFGAPGIEMTSGGDECTLSGCAPAVRHAEIAHAFLVPARTDDGATAILQVPRDARGLTISPYRLIDAAAGGTVTLEDVKVPAMSRLRFDRPAGEVLQEALERGVLALGAETAGIVAALNAQTFSYLMTRRQFGAVLGSFQALQHRAADMWIAAEELQASVDLAIECGSTSAAHAMTSALKVIADTAGRLVGNEAVQLHGAMGVSDELIVSHYFRRLAAIRNELGTQDVHRLRYARVRTANADPLTLDSSPELSAWRKEVRRFVSKHLPPDIAHKGQLGMKVEKSDYVRWQKVLFEHHLFAGAWPKEFGGQGWDPARQLVFLQEAAVRNAPLIIPYGVSMVGPVLYTFGNARQQAEHLPAILRSDVWWCQGYSEPGSGSDLASLKTTAVRDGEHYIVNGTKMWTTEAHWADKMHCLVRTSREGKPQEGISFLLIDMNTPGVRITPIVTIDGIHHTNQIFLDNVRVPIANRVGEEGQGWRIAKFLLTNERTSIADTGPKLRLLRQLQKMLAGLRADPRVSRQQRLLLGTRLTELEIQLVALCALERRYVGAWTLREPGADASALKVRGSEILQALTELALELEGPMAAVHDPADLYRDPHESFSPAQQASFMAHQYLYSRCWSIFGGTNEIQRNLIARQVLQGG